MTEMDIFTFLRCVLLITDIPVIFICDQENKAMTKKALSEGACFFLFEPTTPKDLVNLWQHVFRGRILKEGEIQKGKSHKTGEHSGKPKIKFRAPRMKWSSELERKFTEAVATIGRKEARPKAVLDLMNVPGLTRSHVKSHLQKLRVRLRSINDETESPALQSPIGNMTSLSLAGASYQPYPTVHPQAFQMDSNLQEDSFPPRSTQNPGSVSVNNLISTTVSCSNGNNYASEEQSDQMPQSANQAPKIVMFLGTQGASQESIAVAPPFLSLPENIAEDPMADFDELVKVWDAIEGPINELDFDELMKSMDANDGPSLEPGSNDVDWQSSFQQYDSDDHQ